MGVTLLWVLCVALIVLGLAGTVLPVLPGTLLVGLATWVGIMLGLLAKVVLAFIMVGMFAAALLF